MHVGHIKIIELIKKKFKTEKTLVYIKTCDKNKNLSDYKCRKSIVELSLKNIGQLEIYPWDSSVSVIEPVFKLYPSADVYFPSGADLIDVYEQSPGFKQRLDDIIRRCNFFIVCRNTHINNLVLQNKISKISKVLNRQIEIIDDVSDVSSTKIRESIKNRLPFEGDVAPAVAKYKKENKLYML